MHLFLRSEQVLKIDILFYFIFSKNIESKLSSMLWSKDLKQAFLGLHVASNTICAVLSNFLN